MKIEIYEWWGKFAPPPRDRVNDKFTEWVEVISLVVVVLLLSGTPDQQNKDHNIYNVTNK